MYDESTTYITPISNLTSIQTTKIINNYKKIKISYEVKIFNWGVLELQKDRYSGEIYIEDGWMDDEMLL